MTAALPPEIRRLLDRQDGVIAVGQAVAAGLSGKCVRDQVRAGRWQLLHRGVYAGFTGKPGRAAELRGALLRAGPEAVLSHQTAAEVWGLVDGASSVIHVTVPHGSTPDRYERLAGVVIHQCLTAADVARWLSGRGPEVGHPCGAACPVGSSDVVSTTYGR